MCLRVCGVTFLFIFAFITDLLTIFWIDLSSYIFNPEAGNHILLVPVYKLADIIFAEESESQKYPISCDDFNMTSQFYEYLGDKISPVKYDCEVKVLKKAKESFAQKDQYYDFTEKDSLFEPLLILDRIFNYLGVKSKEFSYNGFTINTKKWVGGMYFV